MKREFWFVVGSQFLYGPEVLETVETRAKGMAPLTLTTSMGTSPASTV